MVARKPAQQKLPADAAAAGKLLLQLDPRFQTLLFLTKDLDAAVEQLAWDAGYLRWLAAFQEAARGIPAVPGMSVQALAFLRSLASQGDADAQWRLDALERARIVGEEAERSRRVSLEDARLPAALDDRDVTMGVVALGAARRLRLELEPRHYLLLAIWSGLERPPSGRAGWAADLARWTRRAGTIRRAAGELDRALRARGAGAAQRAARRGPPASE